MQHSIYLIRKLLQNKQGLEQDQGALVFLVKTNALWHFIETKGNLQQT